MNALTTRNVTVARTRPMLDVKIGLSLWKDRRVALSTKLIASVVGLATMFGMFALDYLMVRWVIGQHGPSQLSMNSLVLSGGSLLFSTIALLWMAPLSAVHLARLERSGVIPLRTKKR